MARGADKLAAAMRDEDYAEEEESDEGASSAYADLFTEIADAIKSGDAEAGATALEEFVHMCKGGGGKPKGKGHGIAIVLGDKD